MSLLNYSTMGEYELCFSAWGEGVLREDGLIWPARPDNVFSAFRQQYGRFPRDISLDIQDSSAFGYWCTGVDTSLLEKLTTLRELILPDTITALAVTPELEKIFRENDTLIRGNFGSFAERFAGEMGLHFRPADYVFARYIYEPADEGTVMSLVFRRNGDVEIKEDITAPGSSAGNTLGHTFWHKLPADFFRTMTAEEIAMDFRAVIYDKTIEEGKLADFIEKAKSHGYYTGKN